MSDRNGNVDFVQFVFKTEGIEKPKAENVMPEDTRQLDFWDRLAALFR